MTLLYKMNRLTSGRRALLCICISMLTCLGTQAAAQSQSQRKRSSDNRLDAQQYMEILGAAVRTLQTNYVDSVEWSRVLTAGIDAMLEELDPYTEFYTEEDEEDFKTMTTGEYAGVGAIIMQMGDTVCISEPYAGMPAAEAGLRAGDRILAIDGENMVKRTTGYVSEHLRGEPATSFELTFLRPGDENPRSVTVTRRKIVIDAVPYYGWLNDSVGYIQLTSFTDKAALEVQAALEKLRGEVSRSCPMAGLVFDLRGNPGGLVDEAVKIVGMFVPKGSMVVETKAKIAAWNSTYRTNTPPIDPDVRIAILIDRSSASASEITSGALQDFDRAVIMGERSYGKGLVQSTRPLPYNTMMKFTSAKYYIPSGRCIQILDYAHRNSDGSVGTVPDSLKKAFKTKNGRTVYDGGGITPDFEVRSGYYSRPTLALSLSGIPEEYAIRFYTRNSAQDLFPGADPSAKQASDIDIFGSFRMTDSQWQDFVKFAAERNFDQRSSAEVVFDQMLKEAKAENMYEKDKEAYDQLSSKIKLSKEEALNLHRDEIQPLIEEEIVQKYAFSAPRVRHMLDYDTVLKKALRIWDGKEDGQPEPQSKEQ